MAQLCLRNDISRSERKPQVSHQNRLRYARRRAVVSRIRVIAAGCAHMQVHIGVAGAINPPTKVFATDALSQTTLCNVNADLLKYGLMKLFDMLPAPFISPRSSKVSKFSKSGPLKQILDAARSCKATPPVPTPDVHATFI